MKWYLIVVLVNISLMTTDVEHLFLWLVAISTSSLEVLFSVLAFLVCLEILGFLPLSVKN